MVKSGFKFSKPTKMDEEIQISDNQTTKMIIENGLLVFLSYFESNTITVELAQLN